MFEGKKILFVVAHPDDTVLHCGGLIDKFDIRGDELVMTSDWDDKVLGEEQTFCETYLRTFPSFYYGNSANTTLQVNSVAIERVGEKLDGGYDYVFTHFAGDHNQDHRAVYEIVRSALRHTKVGMITFPSWCKRTPFDYNISVDINKDSKLEMLSVYESQKSREYFQPHNIKNVEHFKLEYIGL